MHKEQHASKLMDREIVIKYLLHLTPSSREDYEDDAIFQTAALDSEAMYGLFDYTTPVIPYL